MGAIFWPIRPRRHHIILADKSQPGKLLREACSSFKPCGDDVDTRE